MDCDFDNDDMTCRRCGKKSPVRNAKANCFKIRPDLDGDDPVVTGGQPLSGASPDLMPTRDAPGFLKKVKNFASAAAQHVAAGMPMCSDEEIIRRHDICLACEHLKDNACSLCGCPVARVAGYVSKLSWADQECPIGKWGKATPK